MTCDAFFNTLEFYGRGGMLTLRGVLFNLSLIHISEPTSPY